MINDVPYSNMLAINRLMKSIYQEGFLNIDQNNSC